MTPKNRLFYGDNLDMLRQYIKDETVDLCYIDPPFNTKRNYNQNYNNIGQEDIAQTQAFIDTWTWNNRASQGFEEIVGDQYGVCTKQSINLMLGLNQILGKGGLLAYLVSMTQRLAELHRVLKSTGSLYLHCDPTASHYLKLVLDAIFCAQGGEFQNEIVWSYQTGGASRRHYARKHDVILFYTKSDDYIFNANSIREQRTEKSMARAQNPVGARIAVNDTTKLPTDVFHIPALNPMAKERLGYPTQKPEALLERIIQASSNEGDTVLDAYCGCGTTVAVAERLKRQWIGVDITYQSISLILKRLEDSFGRDFTKAVVAPDTHAIKVPATLELTGVPQDFESAVALANKQDDRLRKEFEKWVILTFSNNRAVVNDKKGGDAGIDGIAYLVDSDAQRRQEHKPILFSVKSSKTLSPAVIRELNGTLAKEKAAVGYLLTLYPMANLVKESKKYGTYQNKLFGQSYPKIEVISVQEILEGKRLSLPSTATVEVLKSAGRQFEGLFE
jgi:site-specific DNA-methyltransferase (adenine-specific)